MYTTEQQSAEQGVRDELESVIDEGCGLRVYGRKPNENCNVAPSACHPNQTVLVDGDGGHYLVTVTMLRTPHNQE